MTDRELTEAVATKVMGFEGRHGGWNMKGEWVNEAGFNPINNWNHTMDVVFKISRVWSITYDGYCRVRFGTASWHVEHHDPQRAICLAALQAINPNPNEQ